MDVQGYPGKQPKAVQVSPEDRRKVEESLQEAVNALGVIAKIAAEAIGHQMGAPKQFTITLNTVEAGFPIRVKKPYKIKVEDADGCTIYEDPPGTCTPC